MNFIGIDLEGVLVPEIWVALANKTGIEELKLTTKDISSYKELMEKRISVLNKNHIKADLLFKIASEINKNFFGLFIIKTSCFESCTSI